MSKVGRKSLFKDYMIAEVEKLAALGLTMEEIAWVWNRNVRTLYRYQEKHPEFSHSLKRGKLIADMNVTQSLYKRANGYEYTETHYETLKIGDKEMPRVLKKEIIKQVAPDVTACIYWSKNRRPDLWRDKSEREVEVIHRMTLKDFRESKEEYDRERVLEDFSLN